MMKKVHSMSFNQFFNQDEDTAILKLQRHLKKHHIKYKVIGTTLIIFVAGGIDFATPALAASGIDEAGYQIYRKFLSVGKWIIMLKGGAHTIKSLSAGDTDGAKKHFFSYLLIYLVLLAMPWAFDEIDRLFDEMRRGI